MCESLMFPTVVEMVICKPASENGKKIIIN